MKSDLQIKIICTQKRDCTVNELCCLIKKKKHLYHAVPAETLGESLPVPKKQKNSED